VAIIRRAANDTTAYGDATLAEYNPMPAAKPFGNGLSSSIATATSAAAPSALQQLLSPLGLFISQLPALGLVMVGPARRRLRRRWARRGSPVR
jgi:hypothetical protein